MKSLSSIESDNHIKIKVTSIDGLMGEIHLSTWYGSVIASWGGGWDHVSVSPYDRTIIPSWKDMCILKDIFFKEDEVAIQIHPSKDQYVNNCNNCLHLWRPFIDKLPLPPSVMVGIRDNQSITEFNNDLNNLRKGIY
jgi:hypothetical protein